MGGKLGRCVRVLARCPTRQGANRDELRGGSAGADCCAEYGGGGGIDDGGEGSVNGPGVLRSRGGVW